MQGNDQRTSVGIRLRWSALATLIWVRLGLWVLRFSRLRRTVAAMAASPQRTAVEKRPTAEAICRAVMSAGRFVPRATCLTQALAAWVLLGRHGHVCRLCIGVAKDASGARAHAWLEDSHGTILIGHADVTKLTRLEPIGAIV
jgi:hypothetical protein